MQNIPFNPTQGRYSCFMDNFEELQQERKKNGKFFQFTL